MPIRTVEEIIEQMRSTLVQEGSELATFPTYGNLYAIYRSVASVVAEQDSKIEVIDESMFLSTATGKALDQKAAEFNVTRLPGEPSVGTVIIVGENASVPINTILTDPSTNLQFRTTTRAVVRGNRTTASVEALRRTNAANLQAGTTLRSSLFPAVQFTVGSSFNVLLNQYEGSLIGGSSRETDEQLRSRVKAVISSSTRGTVGSLEIAALSTPGISQITISENDPSLGFVTVYTNNRNQDVMRNLKIRLDEVKPLGTGIIVKAFETINIDIIVSITLRSSEDIQTLTQDLQSELSSYVETIKTGDSITRDGIAATILQNNRVTNVEVISPSTNVELTANTLFALRDVQLRFRT